MDIYWLIVFFVLGVTFGSFFNVVGLRVPQKVSFARGHSHCPNCQRQLEWYDLIPVFSYVLLKGKCRQCQSSISIIYPIFELVTGLLFVYCYWMIGFHIELVTALLLVSMLIIITVADLTYMVIPNQVLLFFLPFLIMGRILSPLDPWYMSIIGAIIGFAAIALIILLSNGGMGAGDMKLFFVLGIVLGWENTLLTLFIGACLGTIVGLSMRIFRRIKAKQAIPFGPYIAMGAVISYFYGQPLISAYLSLYQ